MKCNRYMITHIFILNLIQTGVVQAELPIVTKVESQPLISNVKRLIRAALTITANHWNQIFEHNSMKF